MGRAPGITTAPSGIAAPLRRISSLTASYTGIDFERITPGAMMALSGLRSLQLILQLSVKHSSSIMTGFIPIGSNTPPSCTADR